MTKDSGEDIAQGKTALTQISQIYWQIRSLHKIIKANLVLSDTKGLTFFRFSCHMMPTCHLELFGLFAELISFPNAAGFQLWRQRAEPARTGACWVPEKTWVGEVQIWEDIGKGL